MTELMVSKKLLYPHFCEIEENAIVKNKKNKGKIKRKKTSFTNLLHFRDIVQQMQHKRHNVSNTLE